MVDGEGVAAELHGMVEDFSRIARKTGEVIGVTGNHAMGSLHDYLSFALERPIRICHVVRAFGLD